MPACADPRADAEDPFQAAFLGPSAENAIIKLPRRDTKSFEESSAQPEADFADLALTGKPTKQCGIDIKAGLTWRTALAVWGPEYCTPCFLAEGPLTGRHGARSRLLELRSIPTPEVLRVVKIARNPQGNISETVPSRLFDRTSWDSSAATGD